MIVLADSSRAPQLVPARQDSCWQDNMVPALTARLEPVAAETASVADNRVDNSVVARNPAAETAAVDMSAAADTQAVDKTEATVASRSMRLLTDLPVSDMLFLEVLFRFQFRALATAGLFCWCWPNTRDYRYHCQSTTQLRADTNLTVRHHQ